MLGQQPATRAARALVAVVGVTDEAGGWSSSNQHALERRHGPRNWKRIRARVIKVAGIGNDSAQKFESVLIPLGHRCCGCNPLRLWQLALVRLNANGFGAGVGSTARWGGAFSSVTLKQSA